MKPNKFTFPYTELGTTYQVEVIVCYLEGGETVIEDYYVFEENGQQIILDVERGLLENECKKFIGGGRDVMTKIQPHQLGCYKQVVQALGEEQATIELGKVLETNPEWLDTQEKDVWDSFSFDDSPQGYDFWDKVCDDAAQ
jgi:hypothetical protein